jgi:hypothetical protein
MHQIACSSSITGNGSDLGIREQWLPLFDKYQVDLVLNGHDHDYERSFPVRGFDPMAGTDAATGAPVETHRPHPVTTTDTGVFDVDPGGDDGYTTITVRYFHALGAEPHQPDDRHEGRAQSQLHRVRDSHVDPATLTALASKDDRHRRAAARRCAWPPVSAARPSC